MATKTCPECSTLFKAKRKTSKYCSIRCAQKNNGGTGPGNFKHGYARTKIHNVWWAMICRCELKKDLAYQYYGARGIAVCERWKEFKNFFEDMGLPPKGMTLDRVDNNKGYFKDNCRWVSQKIQCNNRRSSRLIRFQGETKSLAEWAVFTGLKYSTLRQRLQNWPIEKALTSKLQNLAD